MTVTTTPPSPSAPATQPAARPPVGPLDDRARFDTRHIGPRDHDIAAMLSAVGAATMDDLIAQVVPQDIRFDRLLDLPAARDEWTLLRDLSEIADKNKVFRSCIGMGYHGTITPPVVLRNVMENPGWYTQYTPYQAELAQGRLEALLNFQTMIADLTGLPLANASLLDEGTAAAEAMSLCVQQSSGKRRVFIVADDCHPQTIEVVQTRGRSMGVEIRVASPDAFELGDDIAGVLVSYPTSDGRVECFKDLAKKTHDAGALFVAVADPLALVLLTPPGEWGADVCIGSAQRFGVPMGFGGPHAAFMATREEFVRKLPGRLVGVSRDSQGKPALRLAIQTREQHIKRDRATSNICTAQVLLAIMASMYGVYHGPEGLTRITKRVRAYTQTLRVALLDLGHTIGEELVFDTLRVKVKGNAEDVIGAAKARRINIRDFGDGSVGVTLDETTDRNLLADLIAAFGGTGKEDLDALAARAKMDIPSAFARTSKFMTHPVFNTHRSETEMLRYLQQLQSRDLSLTHSMIPLGSCTMKLNATSEMMPVTWPQFAHLHPFAPREQWEGYAEIFRQLEAWLSEITGFAAVSLQPNAGSQGEYAGLLTIKAYHEHHGNAHRDVCLIPESAHGTNPASAVIAGMKVVPVKVNEQGAIVFSDLKAKAEQHAETLAAANIAANSTASSFCMVIPFSRVVV